MTKRYRETIEVIDDGGDDRSPVRFRWRSSVYTVLSVLGHWREDAGYWTGGGIAVPQRDLWRVEARNGTLTHGVRGSIPQGVYELVAEAGQWRLERVWD